MAEKLSHQFGTEVHNLKIGKSFEKKNGTQYHTIRYDFKPVSVDQERRGMLQVGERNSVGVSLPHVGGTGQTQFKGNMKPASTKECVLIIDHETGELTLERVSNQILVKKTRPERPEKPLPPGAKAEGEKGGGGGGGPYEVKEAPGNPYMVKEAPGNPYMVREVPEKPKLSSQSQPGRPTTPSARGIGGKSSGKSPAYPPTHNNSGKSPAYPPHHPHHHLNHHSQHNSAGGGHSHHERNIDSDFSISPLNSAKSSPAGGQSGSAKPSPSMLQVDSLGRPLQSSESSSDSDSSSGSDSDSDGGGKKGGGGGGGGEMASSNFLSQDFATATSTFNQSQSRSGGVLPRSRPPDKKRHAQVQGQGFPEAPTSPASPPPPPPPSMSNLLADPPVWGGAEAVSGRPAAGAVRAPAQPSITNLLGDDLQLSDSDNSD